MKNTSVSVIIPVFNETTTVQQIIDRILKLDFVRELVIVEDGSTDGTQELLKENPVDQRVKIFFHEKNSGKGVAINTGLKNATGEIIAIQDADLEYNPEELRRLIAPIVSGRAEVVYGSRFLDIRPSGMYFFNRLGNLALTFLTNLFYGCRLTDMETGYKVFKRSAVEGVEIKSRDFSVEPELTAKILKRRFTIYELPISYAGRGYGKGKKIKWIHGFSALWAILKYRFVD
ncbi:MAG: glycosyltransferase family 2 protein [Candidatus Omnitrophota bacterium]